MKRLLSALALMMPAFAVAAELNCPELSMLQKAAGFVSWLGLLQVLGVIVAAVCVFAIFGEMFKEIPSVLYEVGGYAGFLVLLYFATRHTGTNQLWFTLGSAAAFGLMFVLSTTVFRTPKKNPEAFFAVLTIVWATIAAYFLEPVVGFFAVGALMGLLGFGGYVMPMGYVIGFNDEDSLHRATLSAFAILAAFTLCTITVTTPHPILQTFYTGGMWLGSFVFYLGLLILASKWQIERNQSYAWRQILMIVAASVGVAVGSIYDIGVLRGMAATFGVLYLIEKPFEIPADSILGYAVIGLVMSIVVMVGVSWAQNHMLIIQPYLLF